MKKSNELFETALRRRYEPSITHLAYHVSPLDYKKKVNEIFSILFALSVDLNLEEKFTSHDSTAVNDMVYRLCNKVLYCNIHDS